jgi:hypothetical protein
MTVKSTVQAIALVALGITSMGRPALAHEIVGVQSYYSCQLTQARAFLRSPNPGATNQDFPLVVLDAAGQPTGERIVVLTVENASIFDGRVTAAGFAWGPDAAGFELVGLNRSYNALTTNIGGIRTGTIGPADYAGVASVEINQPQGVVEFAMGEDIAGVPEFPHTRLSAAIVTGGSFSGGRPGDGLATDGVRHLIAVKGVVPAGVNIEQLLNDAYVRFRQIGVDGDGADTGVYRNLLPSVPCS